MRLGVATAAVLAALIAGAVAARAPAAPGPTYTVSFRGSGSEHQVDQKQNVEDDGSCEAAEHVDVTASVVWTASWSRFKPSGQTTVAEGQIGASQISGSRVSGTHVKDACGLPLDEAPPEWVEQDACDDALVASAGASLTATTRGKTLVLGAAAPALALPASLKCPLNVRNDQLTTHAVVQLKKLQALKRGQSLTVRVGTTAPGPGDLYAPSLDCSAPTKPYEGYRTVDHCQDDLSWSGTVKITRVS
jgi:hypothetical protein